MQEHNFSLDFDNRHSGKRSYEQCDKSVTLNDKRTSNSSNFLCQFVRTPSSVTVTHPLIYQYLNIHTCVYIYVCMNRAAERFCGARDKISIWSP